MISRRGEESRSSHVGTRDSDISRGSNVKSVSVVAQRSTVGVVHGQSRDSESGGTVNAHKLNRGIFESEARNGGLGQRVSIEELGLSLSSVRSLSVPPSGTIAVNQGSGCAGDCDRGSRNRD